MVETKLKAINPSLVTEIIPITTSGDKQTQTSLTEIGGKGLFVKDLEEALRSEQVDIAVHSLKDVPTDRLEELSIAAVLEREDPRDAFICNYYKSIGMLPKGAKFGSASPRRIAQIKRIRPNLSVEILRGNVQTRLDKVLSGEIDATLLAMAGLKRLGIVHDAIHPIETAYLLPAASQGVIGVECRSKDTELLSLMKQLNHRETLQCVIAERALLDTMEGSCKAPIAAHATVQDELITLKAEVYTQDGSKMHQAKLQGNDGALIGRTLGKQLYDKAKTDEFDIW
jgi:hydroxymethylbilane synthase